MADSGNWTLPEYVGEPLPPHARIIFIIVGIFYIIAGLVGNVVIILTVVTNRVMHNPHYYFIINLAVADLTIIAYVVPYTVVGLILEYYPVPNKSLCAFNGVVIVIGYLASLLTLMVISINRYLNICHREIFATMFSRKILSSLIYCSAIWTLAFLSTLPPLVGWSRFHFDVKTHYCGYDRTYSFYYTLFLMLTSIGVPVGIVLACNLGLWRFIHQASLRIHSFKARLPASSSDGGVASTTTSLSTSEVAWNAAGDGTAEMRNGSIADRPQSTFQPKSELQSLGKQRPEVSGAMFSGNSLLVVKEMASLSPPRNQQLTEVKKDRPDQTSVQQKKLVTPEELSLIKSLFVVFVCFAVLMTPYMMACILDTTNQWPAVVHLTCSYTSFTNTCINWVVYGVMNKNFKRAYKKLFCCAFGKSRKVKDTSVSRTQAQDGRPDN